MSVNGVDVSDEAGVCFKLTGVNSDWLHKRNLFHWTGGSVQI
jgi:hypothetical protein